MFTLMYAKVTWVLVSSGTQVQPQVILDTEYLPDYLSGGKKVKETKVRCLNRVESTHSQVKKISKLRI